MNMSVNVTFGTKGSNHLAPALKTKDEFRADIRALENAIEGMAGDKTESPLNHYFAPGMYGREMTIPAGTTIIGKIHKHSHINIISKGIIDVVTEFGTARYKAPYTFVSEPGTKRCVHAITETIWTTIHATDSEDLAEIEKEVIAEDYSCINSIEDKAGDL